jgi:hypothetical protein
MRNRPTKAYSTIGCCGIDCGLCPRYHTEGKSRCPGCAGKDFFEKHPSCSIVTCCFITRKLETCGNCERLICERIKNWDSADSFVTHRNCISNLENIKENGLAIVIEQKEQRLRLLHDLLRDYDDGRSKSFYCLSAALLPIDELTRAIAEIGDPEEESNDRTQVAKRLKEAFLATANRIDVELSYRRKT